MDEVTLWRCGAMTASGNVLQGTLGGAIKHQQAFDKYERLVHRQTIFPNNLTIYDTVSQYYDYDKISNHLTYRGNVPKPTFTTIRSGNKLKRQKSAGWSEVFTYDNSDRLKSIYTFEPSNVLQIKSPQIISYDTRENITGKYDVGDYTYNLSKPHILENIIPLEQYADTTTNTLYGYPFINNQSIVFTPYDRIKTIYQGDYKSDFAYEASLNRASMTMWRNDTLQYRKYYLGNYEEKHYGSASVIMDTSSSIGDISSATMNKPKQSTIYIPFPDGTQAVYISSKTSTGSTETGSTEADGDGSAGGKFYYFVMDHLGSVIAIGAADSVIKERHNYDAYGRRRHPITLEYYANKFDTLAIVLNEANKSITDRGFTGHEHLDEFGLINANARLYDPWLGQFISPDPLCDQYPGISPYSYCANNPLNFIDPTGMSFDEDEMHGTNPLMRYQPYGLPTIRDVCPDEALRDVRIALDASWNNESNSNWNNILREFDKLVGEIRSAETRDIYGRGNVLYLSYCTVENGIITVNGVTLYKTNGFSTFHNGYNVNTWGSMSTWGNVLSNSSLMTSIAGKLANRSPATFRFRNSKKYLDFKFYSNGWKGNQWVTPVSLSKIGSVIKKGGNTLSVFSAGLSFIQMRNSSTMSEKIGHSMDGIMSLFGTYNVYTFAASLYYQIIIKNYPAIQKSVHQQVIDRADMIQRGFIPVGHPGFPFK
jgi:RHS repeat-associated protein